MQEQEPSRPRKMKCMKTTASGVYRRQGQEASEWLTALAPTAGEAQVEEPMGLPVQAHRVRCGKGEHRTPPEHPHRLTKATRDHSHKKQCIKPRTSNNREENVIQNRKWTNYEHERNGKHPYFSRKKKNTKSKLLKVYNSSAISPINEGCWAIWGKKHQPPAPVCATDRGILTKKKP